MKVLVLNSGSSSQKSCLYEIGDTLPDDPPGCVWEGKIEWTDHQAEFSIKNSRGVSRKDQTSVGSRGEAIERLLQSLWSGETQAISGPSDIDVVGHRVVHGGPQYFEPALVTAEVKSAIESVSVFAPAPQSRRTRRHGDGREVAGSGAADRRLRYWLSSHHAFIGSHLSGSLRVVRAGNPPLRVPWDQSSILRTASGAVAGQEPEFAEARDLPPGEWLLFGGDSRRPKRGYDHGFYPAGGSHDGHALGLRRSRHPYLSDATEKAFSGQQLDEVLNQKSGLLGVSGISSDMRQILAASKNGDDPAKHGARKTGA